MDQLPALQLVCALGAGYEKVDVAHARTRGIATGNGAGTNDSCVADHTLALVLASVRQLDYYGAQLRAGVWRTTLPLPAGITGKRLGVLGLGTIGRKIALRAQAFEMEVGYHNRSPKADAPWTYFDSLLALAEWADVLVVATPGGAGTLHLVDATVMRALGPQGHLVNIARGSVVDTQALAGARAAASWVLPRWTCTRASRSPGSAGSAQCAADAARGRLVARIGTGHGGPLCGQCAGPSGRSPAGLAGLSGLCRQHGAGMQGRRVKE
jgi:hypothetical protein